MNENFLKYLESIDMSFALDVENSYDVVKNEFGDYVVLKNGKLYDDRGALFASIRSTIVHTVPNVEFRSDPYIFCTTYCEDKRFDELKRLTKDLLNHGWLWNGASKLDKEKRFFALTKCVVWRNEHSNEWISHSTAIHFNFDHEEPFAMVERERKVLSMNYEPDDSFCPGLSSYDIEIIAQILKAGRAYYDNQSNR